MNGLMQTVVQLIQTVESLDGTSYENEDRVKEIDKQLEQLTNDTIRVRYWIVREVLYCTIIYSNIEVKTHIDNLPDGRKQVIFEKRWEDDV
ncbi:MAG: hypothetical protein BZ138_07995 [Methanosphaera sp. rholeuAM270]|nr:MAG: hypothetical protein BZ138_07995 [Methanosphaera sp. rholeuAM270]